MQKGLSCLAKAVQIGVTALLAVLLCCNLTLIFKERVLGQSPPTLFGFSVEIVASGSMEPALCVDDLILSRQQSSYSPGDVITFRGENSLTTHRIVGVTQEGFVTRGDANNTNDAAPVPPEKVVGRVVGRIPHMGGAILFLKTPLGMTALVFAGFLLIELPFLFPKESERAQGKEEPYEAVANKEP